MTGPARRPGATTRSSRDGRDRIDWLAKNAISTDGSISTNVTTAKTIAFAQSTGQALRHGG